MSIESLDALQTELPELFTSSKDPPWNDEWAVIPIDNPESLDPTDLEDEFWGDDEGGDLWEVWGSRFWEGYGIEFEDPFPGSLRNPTDRDFQGPNLGQPNFTLPPDCLAFYLPFHSYYPDWWGVYLIAEGVCDLASKLSFLTRHPRGLSRTLWVAAARHFLYRHESFHHSVECFATRLEVVQRTSLYRTKFDAVYQQTFGTDECVEEALANAYAIQHTVDATKELPQASQMLTAIDNYVRANPPGYRLGVQFSGRDEFRNERARFAELNHNTSFPTTKKTNCSIWHAAPHSFTGIGRITSRVNYLVNRKSRLGKRLRVDARFISHPKFTKRLRKDFGCSCLRQGKGSHEIWKGPTGRKAPIPRHVGDLHDKLARGILKQLGLTMTWDEFRAG